MQVNAVKFLPPAALSLYMPLRAHSVALRVPGLGPLVLRNGGDNQRTQTQLERSLAPRLGGPMRPQLLSDRWAPIALLMFS